MVKGGTGVRAQLAGGRPTAGKTGTTGQNANAWFAGFTPQLATAVWVGRQKGGPLRGVLGSDTGIYGGTVPAEVFKAYKPDPRTYLGVAAVFDVAPSQVMLAAAHDDDLKAARACGLRTAYIERPFEFGAGQPKDVSSQPGNTLHAADIGALADLLGC